MVTAIRLHVEVVVDDQGTGAVGHESLIAALHQRIAASLGPMGRIGVTHHFHRDAQVSQILEGRATGVDFQSTVVCSDDNVTITKDLRGPLLEGITSVCRNRRILILGDRCGSLVIHTGQFL